MQKFLFDLFPLLIFFAAFKLYGIYVATAAAIAATCAQVTLFWRTHRRFEAMHLITLAVIAIFGGLTIALQDDAFIKWKPSIVNWIFAAAIGATLLFGNKTALEYLLAGKIKLPRPVWKNLNIAWAVFFAVQGLLNMYVAFFYNPTADAAARTAFWVNFKVFGQTALTFIFVIAQGLLLAKYLTEEK